MNMVSELQYINKFYMENIQCLNITVIDKCERFSDIEKNNIISFFKFADHINFSSALINSLKNEGCFTLPNPLNNSEKASSTHSISMHHRNALRFCSVEVFYIIQDNYTFEGIFFPNKKIFIYVEGCIEPKGKIDALLNKLIHNKVSYESYFSSKNEFGGLRVAHISPYHYYYFKLPAVFDLYAKGDCSHNVVSEYDGDFFNLDKILDIPSNKYKVLNFKSLDTPIEVGANSFYTIIGYRKEWADEEIKNQLDLSVLKSSLSTSSFFECKNEYDFIVWLGTTSGKREWFEEESAYIELISELSERFSRILVVVDGWTSVHNATGWFPGAKVYSDDSYRFDNLVKRFNDYSNVDFFSLIGKKAEDKVSIASQVDFIVTNSSTDSMWASRIAKKHGVIHSSNKARGSSNLQHSQPFCSHVPECLVKDEIISDDIDPFRVSYSVPVADFLVFFNEELAKFLEFQDQG